LRVACVVGVVVATSEVSLAADPIACDTELGAMQGDRRDIAARSGAVAAAIEQFEACVRRTAGAATTPDDCRGQADDYQKAVALLNGALDSADRRVRKVGASCVRAAVEAPAVAAPQPPRPPPPPVVVTPSSAPVNASCDLARSYKGRMPYAGVVRICLRSLSEAECRQCLGSLED